MQLTWAIKAEIERTARVVWNSDNALHRRYPSCDYFAQRAVEAAQELCTAHTMGLGNVELADLIKQAPADFRFIGADLLKSHLADVQRRVAART